MKPARFSASGASFGIYEWCGGGPATLHIHDSDDEQPKNYAYKFPNLLTFHDAPTVIEQKLFVMYLEHWM